MAKKKATKKALARTRAKTQKKTKTKTQTKKKSSPVSSETASGVEAFLVAVNNITMALKRIEVAINNQLSVVGGVIGNGIEEVKSAQGELPLANGNTAVENTVSDEANGGSAARVLQTWKHLEKAMQDQKRLETMLPLFCKSLTIKKD